LEVFVDLDAFLLLVGQVLLGFPERLRHNSVRLVGVT